MPETDPDETQDLSNTIVCPYCNDDVYIDKVISSEIGELPGFETHARCPSCEAEFAITIEAVEFKAEEL